MFAACTQQPDAAWVTMQARNAAWELSELGVEARYLVRDRDSKYSAGFDAATGAEVFRTPFRTPVAKAYALHCTSFARSGRSERRRKRRGRPWALRGALSPGGSYKQLPLSLKTCARSRPA